MIATTGYNSLSYRTLAELAGIRAASIHYHFPNKSDLGEAVIRGHHDLLLKESEALLASELAPEEKLDRCFQVALGIGKKGNEICMLGILEAEFETYPDAMQKAVRRLALFHRQMIAQVLEEGRRAQVFQFTGSALEQATLVVTTIQGALQLARTLGDTSVLKTAIKQLQASMRA